MADEKDLSKYTSTIRLRISEHDVHYAGGLVDGAKMDQIAGDLATEVLIRFDGDEGLFRAKQDTEYLAPVRAGDFIEGHAKLVKAGNTSRTIKIEIYKVIEPVNKDKFPASACNVLEKPVLVYRTTGICVTPKEYQRLK